MLERSDLAENALQALHDEDYDRPYNTQGLNAETLIFAGGRRGRSLDGDWTFCVDLLDTGLRQKWFALEPSDPEDRIEPWDYDPYEGETVPVPSCWQMLEEKWYFFEGSAWYGRWIDLDPHDGRRFLRIGAAQYDCKVFVNGRFLGNHYGGSTPFCVELTGAVSPGRNFVLLCVNNARTRDRVPMRNTDWFNYGGITREVTLYDTPATVIRDLFVRLEDGRIRISVHADGPSDRVRVEIPELGISSEIALAEGQGEGSFDAVPELWSPETPRLYDVRAEAGGDVVTDRVGFRTIERRGTEIVLNGDALFLRGISVHEDDAETGKLTSEADLRRRFAHAAELGCNFLRLAHYPHHEMAARLADELGFLLWEEIPVYWAIDFANPATLKDARNQLVELIRRDRNRASVVIWSIGNENPDTDARLEFMRDLAETARSEDPTRLVAAACLVNHRKLRIEDRLAAHIDVIGINEYYGWYDEDFDELGVIGRNSAPDRPVVISETGADGDHEMGPARGLFSLDYQAEVYRKQIATLRGLDYVKGISPWILYDFRVERRQNRFQRGWNRKGLIAADKTTKKPAFDILATYYAERKAGG
ncbi:glycoside hydrolase family 2 protein [Palleronia sp. LCG004]|uniref:glycoside hydrolase family 2 protein n=1 Tax=Palleronia sp. LCG004 TaxID=3079304 RepID=UPI0029434711|nr:glycoside hydrolase family 2 TIM barrel-domain containing protein [Palleronia sp. LCG004]WOI56564.1 glycoside hydrolase family 2 TIM barrel-domain containing protein [Palleronia sp. LCG004]